MLRWFKSLALVVVSIAVPVAASAGDNDGMYEGSSFAVGPIIGTLGYGFEASVKLHPMFVLRMTGTHLPDYTLESNTTQREFGGTTAGAAIDLHPFRDGFRFSAGARYVDITYTEQVADETRTIGRTTYNAGVTGGTTTTYKVDSPIAPYLGLGYDSALFKQGSFSLSTDFGVLLTGAPDVTFAAKNPGSISASDIALETTQKKSDADSFRVLPFFMLSGKYRF